MTKENRTLVRLYVSEVLHSTDSALLCEIEGDEVWLPQSQLGVESDDLEKGDSGMIDIPLWLAEAKGLEESGEEIPDYHEHYDDRW